jgi:hypothetical protein
VTTGVEFMAIQRDRRSSRRGLVYTFLVLIDIAIVSFTFYMWVNNQISKDIVAGIIIGVVILSIFIAAKSDKSRE